MSSVRFSVEGDVSSGTRKRKSKRRTSILKNQSPSRTALGDLDPNTTEQKQIDDKKNSRRSKRVSFANTFEVQEFWTDHHAKQLGLWDTSQEGGQSHQQKSQTDSDSEKHAEGEGGGRSRISVINAGKKNKRCVEISDDCEVTGQHQNKVSSADVSQGPGHNISGLETLLTGPIRNTDLGNNGLGPETLEFAEQANPSAVCHAQPSVKKLSFQEVTSVAGSSTILQSFQPLEYTCVNKYNQEPNHKGEFLSIQSNCESTSESDRSEAYVRIDKINTRRSLTMSGAPSYLCQMPQNDSSMAMSSVSLDQSGCLDKNSSTQFRMGVSQHVDHANSSVTGYMDLTACCNVSFSSNSTSEFVEKRPGEQTDNKSFLKSFMDPKIPSVMEPVMGTDIYHAQVDNDIFVDGQSPEEKTDNKSFFEQLLRNPSARASYDIEPPVTADCSASPSEKLDSRSFLANLKGGTSSKTRAESHSPVELNNKTHIFREDETIAGMDLTTCVQGMQSVQASSNKRPLQERFQELGFENPEITVRFGDVDMELTNTYGGNQQPALSTRILQSSVTRKGDTTQIFDQTSGMDFTTCTGGIVSKDEALDSCSSTRNTIRFTGANMSCLSFMNKTYSKVPLDNTTTILREIDSVLGLKRKLDMLPESMQNAQVEKHRKIEEPYESTRVFPASGVPPLLGRRADDNEKPALSPIKKQAGDTSQGVCNEETTAIEFTRFVKDANLRSVPLHKELTTCVENKELQTGEHMYNEQQPCETQVDRTRLFSNGEMELTEYHTAILPGELASPKPSVTTSSALEHTKIFSADDTCRMELTTCVDNLIEQNTANKQFSRSGTLNQFEMIDVRKPATDMKETDVFPANDTCYTGKGQFTSSMSLKKQDVKVSDLLNSTVEHTKIFQPDETSGMEFTTCVGNLIESNKGVEYDHTRVFKSDDTANMEMTTCVGQIESYQKSRGLENFEHTKLFSEKTGNMERTECIKSPVTLQQQQNTLNSGNTAKMKTIGIGQIQIESYQKSRGLENFEHTKLFSEETGNMEMTECINFPVTLQQQQNTLNSGNTAKMKSTCVGQIESYQKSRGQENIDCTRVFSEETGNMEMTECFESHFTQQQDRFNSEDTTNMEMTTCVGQIESYHPKTRGQKNTNSARSSRGETAVLETNVSQNDDTYRIGNQQSAYTMSLKKQDVKSRDLLHSTTERTKIYQPDETSGMKFTTCVSDLIESNKRVEHDHTRVFNSDDTANMEMTTCVGQIESYQKSRGLENFEHTKVFSEETGNIEMPECIKSTVTLQQQQNTLHSGNTAEIKKTTCVGQIESYQKSRGQENMDCTRVFSEETDNMEMTECISSHDTSQQQQNKFNHVDPANVEKITCVDQIKNHHQRSRRQENNNHTRVFSEETGNMEMTECITSQQQNKLSVSRNVSERMKDGEHTIYFSENTAKVDVTECIGGVLASSFSSSQSQGLSPRASVSQEEQTRMYSDNEAGKMEMTQCIGGVIPAIGEQFVSKSCKQTEKLVTEHNSFVSENTAKMDMTNCVDGLFPDFTCDSAGQHIQARGTDEQETECDGGVFPVTAPKPNSTLSSLSLETGQKESEHITLFSDNTAKMEMNKCIGNVFPMFAPYCATDNTSGNNGAVVTECTRMFSEETGKMDMTECVGAVSPKNVSVDKSIGVISRVIRDHENIGEHTKLFSENTARMEITECVDGMLSMPTERDDRNEGNTSAEIKRNADAHVKVEVSITNKQNKEEIVEKDEQRHSNTFIIKSTKEASSEETIDDKDSDTFTISKILSDSQINSNDKNLRRSDTFTLDKPLDETGLSVALQPCSTHAEGTVTATDVTKVNKQHSSTESYTGDMITEEETLAMENTEVFHMMPGYSALLTKGLFKEPDMPIMPESCQHSMDLASFEASELPLPSSTFQSSQASTSMLSVAQGDKSLLSASVLESATLPTTGEIPMEQFLDFLSVGSTLPKGRRSLKEPVSISPPETLGDFLELSLITYPKYQMFEWVNNYLTSSIKQFRESIKEKETCMSIQNPAIVKELQHATPQRSEEVRRRVISLHDSCKKSVKNKFREWRQKMTISTLESLKKSHEELESNVSIICDSTKKIENTLKELEKYDTELDAAICELERTKLPTETEQQKYLLEEAKLAEINQQVNQLKETIDNLERQKHELQNDNKSMQVTCEELESEQQSLESYSGMPLFDLNKALKDIKRIHNLQEWTLEEYTHESHKAHFTFLEGSLSLVFKLGNKIGCEETVEREVIGISFESLLADDACMAAKVANTMGLKAMDVDVIQKQISTTKNLPRVLQQLSTKLCPARLLYDEVAHIAFWHQVTFCDSRFTVEFSSLEARLKFFVTFELTPGAYPMKLLHHTYRHKIGQNVESELTEVLSSVKPGWSYLSRLVESIEHVIESKICKQQEY